MNKQFNSDVSAGTGAEQSNTAEVTTSSQPIGNTMLAAALSVQQGNELIAKFMKLKNVKSGKINLGTYDNTLTAYHLSWDWLMPVIEKISRIEFDRDENELPFGGTEIVIHTHYPRTFGMLNSSGKPMFRYNCGGLFEAETLIEAAWLATVDMIKTLSSER